MRELRDRIAGALYGVAVGDALGGPLEFMDQKEIQKEYGYVTDMLGGGWLNLCKGETTDDTDMTLAVAEGIVEQPKNPIPAIGRRFVKWLENNPKDVGNTCRSSIAKMAYRSHRGSAGREEWHEVSQSMAKINGGRSGGNGALMRTVYPGLYYRDKETALRMAADIARMTHWDEKSTIACILYTAMIHLITELANKSVEWEKINKLLVITDYSLTLIDKQIKSITDIDFVVNLTEYALTPKELKPTGYVVDSFKCALHSIAVSPTFEEAITEAVNLGGDADTIAAITGGLAGAIYGYNMIPERWINTLAQAIKNRLDRLVDAAVKNREDVNKNG